MFSCILKPSEQTTSDMPMFFLRLGSPKPRYLRCFFCSHLVAKSRYLQCFCACAWQKHWYLHSFHHVVRCNFYMLQRPHCILRCFCFPSATKKLSNNGLKMVQNRFPKAWPRTPQNVNTARVKDFGGSAAKAPPQPAKASCRLYHHTARHRRI